MTATTASIGFGCTMQRDAGGSPSSYSDVGEVIDPGSFTISRDTVEATHTASTARYREFISGLRDAGEFSFTMALVPGGSAYAALISDLESNAAVGYRFSFNDAGNHKWYFNGFITSLAHAAPIDDRQTVAVTIKVTGQPALSAG